ncbi:MAG: TlpA family protein disulfide reductase [Saprospiraceae bacterium]|nr:TlpA family protein disulfide reductase [Saprospiraceae bacterium]
MANFNSRCIYFILLLFSQSSCIEVPKQHGGPIPGIWRGTFVLEDKRQIIITKGKDKIVIRDPEPESLKKVIPFQFEFIKPSDSSYTFILINGSEKIYFNQISLGYDVRNGIDTFEIMLTPYDAKLKGVWEHDKLAGDLIVLDKNNYSIPFTAQYGQTYLFKKIPEKAQFNLTGNWEVVFDKDSADSYKAIGEFTQNNSHITGTFRTETGDYRFLSGQVFGSQAKMSSFDGAHVFMFELNLSDNKFTGTFYSGNHHTASLEATRNENFQLSNSLDIVKIISQKPVDFRLQNADGNWVGLADERYQNKNKIIQILGSWCPNCRDECEFLTRKIKDGKLDETGVIALAFERKKDPAWSLPRIRRYKESLNLPYEILIAGPANKDSVSVMFPQLDKIYAFPTMIFLDKNNVIQKVHTGFDGPATSHFTLFDNEFDQIIDALK